jgi:hypothetical protein
MCPGLVLILWRMTINGKLAKPDFIFITTHWDEVAIPLTKLLETITKKLVEQPLDKDITHEMNILI